MFEAKEFFAAFLYVISGVISGAGLMWFQYNYIDKKNKKLIATRLFMISRQMRSSLLLQDISFIFPVIEDAKKCKEHDYHEGYFGQHDAVSWAVKKLITEDEDILKKIDMATIFGDSKSYYFSIESSQELRRAEKYILNGRTFPSDADLAVGGKFLMCEALKAKFAYLDLLEKAKKMIYNIHNKSSPNEKILVESLQECVIAMVMVWIHLENLENTAQSLSGNA